MYCIYLCTVPDGPPQDIQFQLVAPNQVMFSWNPPLEELRNGGIQSYRISCMDSMRARDPITEVIAGALSRLVSEFVPATLYNCSLSARTSAGFGVNDTVQVLTSKCNALYTNENVGICPNLFHAQCQIDQ